MLRTIIARTATIALITGLLVIASPTPSQAARDFKPWGSLSSANHVLKRGCHAYSYRYTVKPPTSEWSAEIFIVGPGNVGVGSNYLVSTVDRARGRKQFTVCRKSAPYGRYRLKMKVTWSQDRDSTSGFVRPTVFRFTRPR